MSIVTQVLKKRRMEAKELSVRSVNYSDGRLLRSGTLYGGTLSLEQTTPARSNLMKLLLGGVGVNARNSYGAGRNGRNVEFRDVASQSEIVGKTEDVLPLERNRDHRDARRGVYRRAPDQNPGENDVRRKPCSYIQPVWKGNEPTKILHQVTERAGSDRTGSSDDPVNTKQSENMVEQSPSCRKTYLAAVLEGSQQMVRDGGVDQRTISRGHQNKDCHLVGARNQNISPQPLSAVHVYGGRRSRDRFFSDVHIATRKPPTRVSNRGVGSGQQNSSDSGARIRDAFSEAWGNHAIVRRSRKGEHASRGGTTFGETPIPRIAIEIQRRPGHHSARAGDSKGDEQVTDTVEADRIFRKFLEEIPGEKVRHTITRTRRTSKMATQDDYNIPLHVKHGIPQMKVGELRKMMNDNTRKRFDGTWETLVRLPDEPLKIPEYRSFLQASDIQVLEEAGFVSRVSEQEVKARPSMDWVVPFTVVEPGEDNSERRRFIAWTQEDNFRIKETYRPYVPVHHAAYYLHRTKAETAVKRDLACGFWQVGIPLSCRQKFRFASSQGEIFELNVMPMGHRCAPEIMHTLTSTLGGDSQYCKAGSSFMHEGLDVYIDGVRFAGTEARTQEYAKFVDSRAENVNALFKDAGTPSSKEYTFNGVTYLHKLGKVALGPKLTSRLQKDDFARATYSSLESGVGRLIFASAVMGLNLPQFHLELKIVRRRINRLNREPGLLDCPVSLPTQVRISLTAWRDSLLYRSPVVPPVHPDTVPHKHILCTDALATGWGAVLYLDYGPMYCTGARWPEDFEYEVNRVEARAVRLAFEKYGHHFQKDTCIDLYVDNTSCVAAINRKISSSDGITSELRRLLEFLSGKGIAVKAQYVCSKENPADPYSRV